jgi:hypothetical protein
MDEERDAVGGKSLQRVGDRSHRLGLPGVSGGDDVVVVELVDALLLNGLSSGDGLVGIRQPEAQGPICAVPARSPTLQRHRSRQTQWRRADRRP